MKFDKYLDMVILEEPETKNADSKPMPEKKEKDPHHFRTLAADFILDTFKKRKVCRYYQGRILQWNGKRYQDVKEIENVLRIWFAKKNIPANNTTIGNVVPWIKALTEVRSEDHPQLPCWLETPLCKPDDAITFDNGILDATQGIEEPVLHDHTPNWLSLSALPYTFDKQAQCPQWLQFLNEVLEGDQQRIALLQEFFGYCLTPDNSLQKMLVLRGVSRSGKGTIVKVLEAVLGRENVTGFSLTALAERFGTGSLVGKLVAVVGEVNLQKNRDKYQIFETLNKITGNDPVDIEFKHQVLKMSTRLPVRFVISCNEMPSFSDDSGAFSERLLIVDFEKACPPEKRDPDLADRLCAEASGVANWALEGLARLRKHKRFSTPDKMASTLRDIGRDNSPTRAFLQDKLIIHPSLDTGYLPDVTIGDGCVSSYEVPCELVQQESVRWTSENGMDSFTPRYFAKNLRVILPKLTTKPKRMPDGTVKKVYVGLKLKSDK